MKLLNLIDKLNEIYEKNGDIDVYSESFYETRSEKNIFISEIINVFTEKFNDNSTNVILFRE